MTSEASLAIGGRDPFAGRIPISVITGFLGSGKTTVLKKLLRHPGMSNAAVIVNEFGEESIDHELLETSSERMALLDNGCLCCTVRTDLQETLRDILTKRLHGEVIQFDRVFVETTGLADPAPVVQTLASDALLADKFRLDCVVTLVDAVNGLQQLDTLNEPLKQAAIADRLLLSKTDLAKPEQVTALRARLADINPQAMLIEVVQGEVDPALLIDVGLTTRTVSADKLSRWIGPLAGPKRGSGLHPQAGHTSGIESFCLWFERPFTWASFETCMTVLTSLRGPDLLRVKGLVNVEGEVGPVVVQGVQHIFHPPAKLPAWSDDDRRSRIVFITRGIERATIENLFRAVGALGTMQAG
ncbi:MAG: GTP-binding protein [Betaproteobacteria bacterium]|nr:GTP-binding protein [Betaproteobacteria bacterium]